ncbi:uncharacterized protein OCT59_015213 [Rhizophagus irregularis]|uniref:uncharacterized protein n=1 Tax=Rhizophagus irregularis TaxID=588596 RepID=UPI0033313258|nr:hypothetical protein OCT59_015213 [Rhizophagus irregularis]
MVLDYAEEGSLRNYLDNNYCELSWRDKIRCLRSIAGGLENIHYKEIIHRDLHVDANPLNRPSSNEIKEILLQWIYFYDQTELQDQIREADEINKKLSTNRIPSTSLELLYETHSEAIYTSRLLDFSNLPEPKNSVDYYERYDNIVSLEYSVSQQINISQLEYDRDNKSN